MTMDVRRDTQKVAGPQECAGCGKKISDRFLLKALDMYWHEDCLKCGCCDCRLGEVGSTLFTKANLILCKRDYLRLFGATGYCAACNKVIPAFEMVMRARSNVYHLECFACQQCNHRFCVGDRFYLWDNKILCEYDYEERLVFANIPYHGGGTAVNANGAGPPQHQHAPPGLTMLNQQQHQQQHQQQQIMAPGTDVKPPALTSAIQGNQQQPVRNGTPSMQHQHQQHQNANNHHVNGGGGYMHHGQNNIQTGMMQTHHQQMNGGMQNGVMLPHEQHQNMANGPTKLENNQQQQQQGSCDPGGKFYLTLTSNNNNNNIGMHQQQHHNDGMTSSLDDLSQQDPQNNGMICNGAFTHQQAAGGVVSSTSSACSSSANVINGRIPSPQYVTSSVGGQQQQPLQTKAK